MPRPPGPSRNTLAVELPGDAVEPQTLVPERLDALRSRRFALVIPEGLAALAAALRSRFFARAPASFSTIMLLSYCANTPIICRKAMRLGSDAMRSGSVTLTIVKPCCLKY